MITTLIPNINDIDFLIKQNNGITDSREYELPSHYAERVRYLPKELTPIPGKYSFEVAPFLREILDCLSPTSPVREVAFMKGAQIMATTGILENYLAYNIGCDPKPQLYVSADKELVKTGMKTKVERLIDTCNLRDLIFSQTGKRRSTGDTATEKDYPGGFLHAIGARNPGKLRSMSYPVIVFDEIDGFPAELSKEGDPISLAKNRTNAYASKRKILYLSTPLIMQTSIIYSLYLRGDQRRFFVPCKYCGKMQILEWHGADENKIRYGIVFDITPDGLPDYSTVGYKCRYCDGVMKNHDKSIILSKGEWRPTAKPELPDFRSYQLSALYSPPGMYSFENMVADWSEAWDIVKNRVKDKEKLRSFYNTKRGDVWEEKGNSIKYDRSVLHRRTGFILGEIPEKIMIRDTGCHALLLTAAVDVQSNGLYVVVIAWGDNGTMWIVDFKFIEGLTDDEKIGAWVELDKFIIEKVYLSETGRKYKIIESYIDSGYKTDVVYRFCKNYSCGVTCTKGDDWITGGLSYKSFSKETLDKSGLPVAYFINTVLMKDRLSNIINTLQWDSGEYQPAFYFNTPEDLKDEFFRHLESENRVEVRDKITNKFLRVKWVVSPTVPNHGLDCVVGNMAGLEIIADRVCREVLELPRLIWEDFWTECKKGLFYS